MISKRVFVLLTIALITVLPAGISEVAASSSGGSKTPFFEVKVDNPRKPLTNAQVFIFAGNLRRDSKAVELEKIELYSNNELLTTITFDKKLISLASDEKTKALDLNKPLNQQTLKEALRIESDNDESQDLGDNEKLLHEVPKNLVITKVDLDLKKLNLTEEQNLSTNLEAKGYFTVNDTQIVSESSTQAIQLSSLPGGSWGWYPGDAHIHTAFSDGYYLRPISVASRVKNGKDNGFKWVIMTDHLQQLDIPSGIDYRPNANLNGSGEDEWQKENEVVAGADKENPGIFAMNGGEISTELRDDGTDSHYLAYDLKEYVENFPPKGSGPEGSGYPEWDFKFEDRNAGQIINEVYKAGGIGFIAHPYSHSPITGTHLFEYPWDNNYWNVRYASGAKKGQLMYQGVELFSGLEDSPSKDTLNKWDSLLYNNLKNTFKNGRFVVGTANSDAHFGWDYGDSMTYVKGTKKSGIWSIGKKRVYTDLRTGRAIASNGFLVDFSIRGRGVGQKLTVNKDTVLKINIKWQSDSTGIYGKGLNTLKLIRNAGYGPTVVRDDISGYWGEQSGNITYTYKVTRSGYFRVEGGNEVQGEVDKAYTNPIFIKVRSSSPQKAKLNVKVRNFITKSAIAGAAFGTDDRRYVTTTNSAGEGSLDIPLAVYNQLVEDVESQEDGLSTPTESSSTTEATQLFNFLAEANRYSSKVIKDIELTGGQTQTLEVELDPFAITNDRPDDNNFQSTFNPSDYNGGQFDYDRLRLAIKKGKLGALLLKDLFEANEAYKNLPSDATEEEKEARETDITTAFDIYASNRDTVDGDYKTSPDIALLEGGSSREFTQILKEFKEPTASVNSQFTPTGLANYPVLIIPTGALIGLETSPIFKASLEEYVKSGGTVISLAQQRGEHYRVLPGGELFGKGWQEAISCRFGDAEIDNYHPMLASLRQISDINQDGYFTQYPENAKILIRGTTNAGGHPVLLTYPFGKGRVVAASIYPDWSYGLKQETLEDKSLIRDMVGWAKEASTKIPEFKPNSTVEVTQKVTNFTSEEEGEAANAVKFTLMSPDRKPIEAKTVDLEEELAPGQSTDVKFTTEGLTKKGIYFVDYRLLLKDEGFDENENPVTDTEEIQPQAEGARFTVTDYKEIPGGYANQGSNISYGVTMPEERLATGSDAVFNVWMQNDGQTEQEITARYGNNQETKLVLQPNEQNNFTYLLSNVQSNSTFKVSFFNSAGEFIGQASKGYWVFAPDVDLAVDTDKSWYQGGDTVNLLVKATNKKPVDYKAILRVAIYNPTGLQIGSAQREVSLVANQVSSQEISLMLPDDALAGSYIYQVEAIYNGERVGLKAGMLEVQKPSLQVSPILPLSNDTLSFKVRNLSGIAASADLTANISEKGKPSVWQDSKTVSLGSFEEVIVNFQSSFGDLSLAPYELNYSLNIGSKTLTGRRSLGLPEITFVPDKPFYSIRENMTGNLIIRNASQLPLNSLKLEIASGEFLYSSAIDLPALASGAQTTIPVSIPIPETTLAGNHGFTANLRQAGNGISKLLSFTIPQSKLTLSLGKTDYSVGDSITVSIENTGGVDTAFDYWAQLVDFEGQDLLGDFKGSSSMKAGEVTTFNINIPQQSKTGNYGLKIKANDFGSQKSTTLLKDLKVAGIDAQLNVRTQKQNYFLSDNITGLIYLSNSISTLTSGLLELNVFKETFSSAESIVNSNTPRPAYHSAPNISGDKIVWEDWRNNEYSSDIYLYDLTTNKERRITTDSSSQYAPSVWGNRIVWLDNRSGGWFKPDIYFYDLLSGTEKRLTTSSSYKMAPDIWEDKIVWTDERNGNWDIYLYDLSTNVERRITTSTSNQWDPKIADNKIVWWDRNGYDIYLYDLATNTEKKITGDIVNKGFVFIEELDFDGTKIVWDTYDWTNRNSDIFLYDLNTQTQQKITSNLRSIRPSISGNKIAWMDYTDLDYEIYLYDISTKVTRQITNDSYNQYQPVVSEGRLVWEDAKDGNIYLYDSIKDIASQVNSDESFLSDGNQYYPSVFGNKFVWADDRNYSLDIYYLDQASGEEKQITSSLSDETRPAVSNNAIVWEDQRDWRNSAIYAYDFLTQTERKVSSFISTQKAPDIFGNKIVWEDYRNGNADIYLYDLTTNIERRITADFANQQEPAIFEDKIVWTDYRNGWGNPDIYMFDLSTSREEKITSNLAYQSSPDISGNKIVWSDGRNGRSDIYLYDLATSVERRITVDPDDQYDPAIYGSKIVWADDRNSWSSPDIYMFDLETNTEQVVTINPAYQYDPAIFNDKIVWTDERNSTNEVYDTDIYLLTTGSAQSFWQKELPVNLAPNETANIVEEIGQLNTTGKLYFEGILKSATGQVIDDDTYPFYIYPGNSAVTISTDKKTYKPNEVATITGTVTNNAEIPLENKTLTVYKNDVVAYTENIASLAAGESKSFSFTTVANADFNLKATFDTATVEDSVKVVEPKAELTLDGPSIADREPFNLNANLKNTGGIAISGKLTFSDESGVFKEENISLGSGEQKNISRPVSISKNTNFKVDFVGDLNLSQTKTVIFGEKATMNINSEPAYLEGNVSIPYQVVNTGQLETTFDTIFSLNGINYNKNIFLPVGGSITDNLLFENLLPGDYTLSYSTPFGQGQKTFKVVKQDALEPTVNLTVESPTSPISDYGKVKVDIQTKNVGLNDFSGTVRVESAFDKQEQELIINEGDTTNSVLYLNARAAIAGPNPVNVTFINSAGETVLELNKEIEIPPADFQITEINPGQSFSVGSNAGFSFEVKNTGFLEGQTTVSLDLHDIGKQEKTLWLKTQESQIVNFDFLVPLDIPEGSYKGLYRVSGQEAQETTFNIEGLKVEASASLDKEYYQAGEEATLTLNIKSLTSYVSPLTLTARAQLGGIEDVQSFILNQDQSLSLTVPVQNITNDRIFYGLYLNGGRSVYLNSIYVRINKDNLALVPDKQVYNAGDTVTMTVDTTETGILHVEALDLGYTNDIALTPPTTTFNFALPQVLSSGTYVLNYQLGEKSGLVKLDVAGYKITVNDTKLNKNEYSIGDDLRAVVEYTNEKEFNGRFIAWLERPDGRTDTLVDENRFFNQETSALEINGSIIGNSSGSYRLVYAFMIGDTILATAQQTFDVSGPSVVNIKTSKPNYQPGEDASLVLETFNSKNSDAILKLQLNGNLFKEETINIPVGYSSQIIDIGKQSLGVHTLKAILSNQNTNSAKATAFEVRDEQSPETTIIVDGKLGNNEWYTSDVRAELNSKDDELGSGLGLIRYNLNQSGWQDYSIPIEINTEGITDFYYYAQDLAGNFELPKIETVKIDKTSPANPVLHSPPEYSLKDNPIDLIWAASTDQEGLSGVSHYLLEAKEGEAGSWIAVEEIIPNNNYQYEGTIAGQIYYFRIRAVDNAGNISGYSNEVFTTVGKPEIVFNPLPEYVKGEVSLSVQPSNYIPTNFVFYLDGSAIPFGLTNPFILDTKAISDGEHIITATASDDLGNSAGTSITIKIDNFLPITTAYKVKYRMEEPIKLKWLVEDPFTGGKAYVKIIIKRHKKEVATLDLGLHEIGTVQETVYEGSLKQGRYKHYVYATDQAGNEQANIAKGRLVIKGAKHQKEDVEEYLEQDLEEDID